MVPEERQDPLHVPLAELKGSVHEDEFRPSWRGWIHTGVLQFVVAAGVLLVVFSDGLAAKIGRCLFRIVSFVVW